VGPESCYFLTDLIVQSNWIQDSFFGMFKYHMMLMKRVCSHHQVPS